VHDLQFGHRPADPRRGPPDGGELRQADWCVVSLAGYIGLMIETPPTKVTDNKQSPLAHFVTAAVFLNLAAKRLIDDRTPEAFAQLVEAQQQFDAAQAALLRASLRRTHRAGARLFSFRGRAWSALSGCPL
jgi:hypothetical protein